MPTPDPDTAAARLEQLALARRALAAAESAIAVMPGFDDGDWAGPAATAFAIREQELRTAATIARSTLEEAVEQAELARWSGDG